LKRILFVISQLYRGGAENALVNLLKKLSVDEYKLDLIILDNYPVENAVSLIPEIPKSIRVYDAWSNRLHVINRIKRRLHFDLYGDSNYTSAARSFARKTEYDCAIHVGEWISPMFLVKSVKTCKRMCWITICGAGDSFL